MEVGYLVLCHGEEVYEIDEERAIYGEVVYHRMTASNQMAHHEGEVEGSGMKFDNLVGKSRSIVEVEMQIVCHDRQESGVFFAVKESVDGYHGLGLGHLNGTYRAHNPYYRVVVVIESIASFLSLSRVRQGPSYHPHDACACVFSPSCPSSTPYL